MTHDHDAQAVPGRVGPLEREARPLVFSRAGMRAVDRDAIELLGIPGLLLMEHAARGLAAETLRLREESGGGSGGPIHLVCGGGGNGGDGWAAGRFLHAAGVPVRAVDAAGPAGASPHADAAVNREMALRIGIPTVALSEWRPGAGDVVIDALLGTGATTPPRGMTLAAIAAIGAAREIGAVIVAADLPSGLDADRGEPLETAVRADLTVTFAGLKQGLLAPGAAAFTGRIVVVPIGVPRALLERHALRDGDAGG